jgi:hypothetical protein
VASPRSCHGAVEAQNGAASASAAWIAPAERAAMASGSMRAKHATTERPAATPIGSPHAATSITSWGASTSGAARSGLAGRRHATPPVARSRAA